MTFRIDDGDRDKFNHSLHHYPVKKFAHSLHYYPQKIIHPEQKYYKKQRKLECNSLYLNGTSSYIDCGNNVSLNMVDKFTISLKIKIINGNANDGIITKMNDSHTKSWSLYYLTDGYIRCFIGDGVGIGAIIVSNNGGYADSLWHHLVLKYNGTVYMYIDNILQSSTYPCIMVDSGLSVQIGKKYVDSGSSFTGFIKQVLIYHDFLSDNDISNLYKNIPVSNNLVLDLPLKTNCSEDTIVKDLSGNNNNGTLTDCEWNCDWIREKHKVI